MSDAHPLVQAARESEKEIGRHLHDELAIAIRGVKADLRLTGDRIRLLEERLAEATGRLERLAALRAPYANQLADSDAPDPGRSNGPSSSSRRRAPPRRSASVTNLISRIDTPDAGTKPLGPGRSMIVLFGIVGGLVVGLGVLLVTARPRSLRKSTTPRNPPRRALCPRPNRRWPTAPFTGAGLPSDTGRERRKPRRSPNRCKSSTATATGRQERK